MKSSSNKWKILRKILLICGALSALLYIVADIIAAVKYPGYSYTSQTISELSAIGAPTQPILSITGTIYLLLVIAFGFGVLLNYNKKRSLRILGILILIFGLVGFAWPFAQMHQREVLASGGGTIKDTFHLIIGGIDSLLFFLILGFGTNSFGKKFRIYSIVTIILVLVFGILMSIDAPKVSANEPTPWLGINERIAIFSPMIWLSVFAIMLLREENLPSKRKH